MRRHLSFWLAVAGVSVLANFALEAFASASPGLARFTAFAHRGAS
ncbi:MAG: hypothetical protein ACRDSS_00430 [Actinocrinis sp.]